MRICNDMDIVREMEVIYRGEDKILNLRIRNEDGSPFDVTGATEITARFRKSDDNALSLTMTGLAVAIVVGAAGSVSVMINQTSSLLLKLGKKMSFTLMIDIAGARRIVNFEQVLWVQDPAV